MSLDDRTRNSSQEKEDRLLVLRESELREFAMNVSAAQMITFTTLFDLTIGDKESEAIGQGLGDFFQQQAGWISDHASQAQLGRPPIPQQIIEGLATLAFARRQSRQLTQVAWDDLDEEQRDSWRGVARRHLVDLWDDLTDYFSTQGVLFWTRLTPEDADAVLSVLEGGADAGTLERADQVKPLLREAAERGGTA